MPSRSRAKDPESQGFRGGARWTRTGDLLDATTTKRDTPRRLKLVQAVLARLASVSYSRFGSAVSRTTMRKRRNARRVAAINTKAGSGRHVGSGAAKLRFSPLDTRREVRRCRSVSGLQPGHPVLGDQVRGRCLQVPHRSSIPSCDPTAPSLVGDMNDLPDSGFVAPLIDSLAR
jgi:hypothetical protein